MDIEGGPRPHVTTMTASGAARSDFAQTRPETELGPARVVQSGGRAEPGGDRAGSSQSAARLDLTERRVTIDEETRELVAQSLDSRTGIVLEQSPDRSLLALRAYLDRVSGGPARGGNHHGDGLELRDVTA